MSSRAQSIRCVLATCAMTVISVAAHADHFYTTSPTGELAQKAGYKVEGVAGFVYSNPSPNTVPLYRWFKSTNGAHFYTTDANGEIAGSQGYKAEGIAFYCAASARPGTVPFYRWFRKTDGMHFYTTSESGELAPSVGYAKEGIACHISNSQTPGTTPLFRWYLPSALGSKPGHTTSQDPSCVWDCRNDPAVGMQCQQICKGR
ncbi:hypothetical protein [Ferribacterium limneticum]|uniref:hypothetical protein n=1 Tax=Ferribacterium limneticum TaxID=76259 RepID=UPI00385176EC